MRRHLPQTHDRLLGETVAQIFLRWVAAQVFERQYCEHDPRLFWLPPAGCESCAAFEAVPLTEDCFDILWLSRIITEGLSDFSDGGVNAVIGVEMKACSPELRDDFVAADQPSFSADQQNK